MKSEAVMNESELDVADEIMKHIREFVRFCSVTNIPIQFKICGYFGWIIIIYYYGWCECVYSTVVCKAFDFCQNSISRTFFSSLFRLMISILVFVMLASCFDAAC